MGSARKGVIAVALLLLVGGTTGVVQARGGDIASDPGFVVCAPPWAGDPGSGRQAPPWAGDPGFTVAFLEATPQIPAAPHC
jgi:hypothetical protein